MRTIVQTGIVAGITSLSLAFPVAADISAIEARNEIVGFYESFGYTVDIGSEKISDGALLLDDVSIQINIPDGKGQIAVAYDWVKMMETGGAVDITFPATIEITGNVDDDGKKTDFAAHIDATNMAINLSGSMDNLRIETNMDIGQAVLDRMTVDEKDIPLTAQINFGKTTADYTIVKADSDRRQMNGTASIASLGVVADAKEPDGDGFFNFNVLIADLTYGFTADIPKVDNPDDLMKAGLAGSGQMSYGNGSAEINFADKGDSFSMTSSAVNGRLDVGLTPDLITYDVGGSGVEMMLSSSDIPLPSVEMAYDDAEVAFKMPLSPGQEPKPFAAKVALRGVTVGESLWALIDSGKVLPRDPATVVVDLSGTAMVLANLMDPETLADMKGPPMLPVSLNLNELTASIAGALLNGSGEVKFNFQNPNTINGIPAPAGEVNLSLKGGFGLLDKLVSLGLVPEDAATGLRAMLGAFAKPVGDDQFESKIEVSEDGSIKANGQRIK